MIPDGVTTESPLGASDHSLLSFSFRCYTKQKPKSHTTLMYHKADYDSMRQDLRQDWDMLFKNMSTNQMWSILQNKINAAINKHVPRTKSVLTCMDVIQSTDQSEEKTQGMAEIHEHTRRIRLP